MDQPSTTHHNAVRPGERTPNKRLAALLAGIRHLVGGDRFENLYRAVRRELLALAPSPASLLDYGCGSMEFSRRLRDDGVISRFLAVDLYPAPSTPHAQGDWQHYRQIPDGRLPKLSERFDVAIVIDVLHHAEDSQLSSILADLGHSAQFVIVKDHFEYGPMSRQLLRIADWFGNFAYGVRIPNRYFSLQRWERLVADAGMREVTHVRNVRVHNGLFGLLLAPRYHFISVLQRR
jgi:hypothetical protein